MIAAVETQSGYIMVRDARMLSRKSGGRRETIVALENRTALVLKMIVRLYDHPPPDR